MSTVEVRRALPVDTSDTTLTKVTAALAAHAAENDRAGTFPAQSLQLVQDAGLLQIGVGARFGGSGAGLVEIARVLQALGRGDVSVGLIAAMTIAAHGGQARTEWWPEDLYQRVVADGRERPLLLNAVRAEPALGAPARGGVPATKVRRDGDGWIVSGRKAYATGAEGLDYHIVFAASDEADPLVGHVIVPGDDPGVEVVRTWDHLGLRASSTHDVVYHDVKVPFDNFVGERASASSGAAERELAGLWLVITALYIGVARAAQEFFVRFAHERVPSALGKPIAETERIQTVSGEIESRLLTAELVLSGIATRLDGGDRSALALVPAAKVIIVRNAIGAVETAVAALGNPALARSNPLERHLRDVLSCRIHPPQEDTALLVTGRQALASH